MSSLAVTTNGVLPVCAVLVLIAALLGLLRRWPSLRGTTLRASWWWFLTALTTLGLGSIANAYGGTEPWATHTRYLSALATLCPVIAVLGAKRPQDKAWQFIVASWWLVAALPSLQQWFSRPNALLDLHGAWKWFLFALILIGMLNYMFTRYAGSALLFALGQVFLLSPCMPWFGQTIRIAHYGLLWQCGLVCWCVALTLWGWDLPRRRRTTTAMNRLWLDYRDLVGTMWALRVAERINAAARQSRWPARLRWHGWSADSQFPPALERSLRMLLRRFVSQAWIDCRLDDERGNDPPASNNHSLT